MLRGCRRSGLLERRLERVQIACRLLLRRGGYRFAVRFPGSAQIVDLTTHAVPIAEAPQAYKTFQDNTDGCIKVVLKP